MTRNSSLAVDPQRPSRPSAHRKRTRSISRVFQSIHGAFGCSRVVAPPGSRTSERWSLEVRVSMNAWVRPVQSVMTPALLQESAGLGGVSALVGARGRRMNDFKGRPLRGRVRSVGGALVLPLRHQLREQLQRLTAPRRRGPHQQKSPTNRPPGRHRPADAACGDDQGRNDDDGAGQRERDRPATSWSATSTASTTRSEAMLAELEFQPGRDRLFALGDLIDRGPRSVDTLEWMEQGRITLSVRGEPRTDAARPHQDGRRPAGRAVDHAPLVPPGSGSGRTGVAGRP